MCSVCGKNEGKNRHWDNMLAGYFCDECWNEWKIKRGVIHPTTPMPPSTNPPIVVVNPTTGGDAKPTITKCLNNKYIISIEHPLIRPGLKITTESSERYVARVVKKMMEIIREINQ